MAAARIRSRRGARAASSPVAAVSHRRDGDCRSQGLEFGRDGRIQAISGI